MSLQDITIDLDDLSFEIPRRASSKHFGGSIYKEIVPPAITVQRVVKTRNRPCIPSDDEDTDQDDEDDQSILSSEENDFGPSPRVQSAVKSNTPVVVSTNTTIVKKPVRKSQPLPSDDEDSEDEDEDGEEEQRNQNVASRKNNQRIMHHSAHQPVQTNAPVIVEENKAQKEEEEEDDDDDNEALIANRDPNAGPILTLVEGSHLQQLHQMQQYHQAKLALFQHQIQPSKSNSANMRRQQHGNGRTMSGMDLLKQLEQEKADAKRIKPKVVHKLEGLLGQLPEPGSHNISFQQVQQQQQQQRAMQNQHQQQHQHHHQQQHQQYYHQQQRGYLDPNMIHYQQQAYHYNQHSRSPSPIHHRSLSPNSHNRSPSPNARDQPNRNIDHRNHQQQPSYSQ